MHVVVWCREQRTHNSFRFQLTNATQAIRNISNYNDIFFCIRFIFSLLFTMFVTVFLSEAKARTVVPKKFIYKLSQVSLDNHGVNANQNRRIYFSKRLFENLQNGEIHDLTGIERNMFCWSYSQILG